MALPSAGGTSRIEPRERVALVACDAMRCSCDVHAMCCVYFTQPLRVPVASRQVVFYLLSGKKLFHLCAPGLKRGLRILVIELLPGMQLYIPSHWWHRVQTIGGDVVDISINGVKEQK